MGVDTKWTFIQKCPRLYELNDCVIYVSCSVVCLTVQIYTTKQTLVLLSNTVPKSSYTIIGTRTAIHDEKNPYHIVGFKIPRHDKYEKFNCEN